MRIRLKLNFFSVVAVITYVGLVVWYMLMLSSKRDRERAYLVARERIDLLNSELVPIENVYLDIEKKWKHALEEAASAKAQRLLELEEEYNRIEALINQKKEELGEAAPTDHDFLELQSSLNNTIDARSLLLKKEPVVTDTDLQRKYIEAKDAFYKQKSACQRARETAKNAKLDIEWPLPEHIVPVKETLLHQHEVVTTEVSLIYDLIVYLRFLGELDYSDPNLKVLKPEIEVLRTNIKTFVDTVLHEVAQIINPEDRDLFLKTVQSISDIRYDYALRRQAFALSSIEEQEIIDRMFLRADLYNNNESVRNSAWQRLSTLYSDDCYNKMLLPISEFCIKCIEDDEGMRVFKEKVFPQDIYIKLSSQRGTRLELLGTKSKKELQINTEESKIPVPPNKIVESFNEGFLGTLSGFADILISKKYSLIQHMIDLTCMCQNLKNAQKQVDQAKTPSPNSLRRLRAGFVMSQANDLSSRELHDMYLNSKKLIYYIVRVGDCSKWSDEMYVLYNALIAYNAKLPKDKPTSQIASDIVLDLEKHARLSKKEKKAIVQDIESVLQWIDFAAREIVHVRAHEYKGAVPNINVKKQRTLDFGMFRNNKTKPDGAIVESFGASLDAVGWKLLVDKITREVTPTPLQSLSIAKDSVKVETFEGFEVGTGIMRVLIDLDKGDKSSQVEYKVVHAPTSENRALKVTFSKNFMPDNDLGSLSQQKQDLIRQAIDAMPAGSVIVIGNCANGLSEAQQAEYLYREGTRRGFECVYKDDGTKDNVAMYHARSSRNSMIDNSNRKSSRFSGAHLNGKMPIFRKSRPPRV